MKMIVMAVIAVIGMALAGWLTFASSDENISIEVNKAEVKADTKSVVEAGENLLDEISDATTNVVEDAKEAVNAPEDKPEAQPE